MSGSATASSARSRIREYLQRYVGEVVSSEELMIVAGISEYARRIRELRVQEGFQILSGLTIGAIQAERVEEREEGDELPSMKVDEYMLVAAAPDTTAAQRWEIANAIRNSVAGVKEKLITYFRGNVGQVITGEELVYLAKDASEWPRRVRELRTEEGWPIVTKFTGDPSLPMGTYRLLQDRQAPTHDRKISDPVRRAVLVRDDYSCQNILSSGKKCNWQHSQWQPADPRNLELHHRKFHVHGGKNEADNLITLCNICHDDIHRLEAAR
jgi:hypothetical protein